jgi:uncharacterized protein (DUF2252 family)
MGPTRRNVRRSSHAGWTAPANRADPLAILDAQNRTRLADLVPVRMGRMCESPFAFMRGSAAVMAADLATTPTTGIEVQACGDAHLLNFGLFASPERTVLFDLNDFDETAPGPWEWDVKRLAVSAVMAARQNGWGDDVARRSAADAVLAYRMRTAELAAMASLDVYYTKGDVEAVEATIQDTKARNLVKRSVAKAKRRTSSQALTKLTVTDEGGKPRIVDQPPLVVRVTAVDQPEEVEEFFEHYARSVRVDVRRLLARFEFVDVARKVVGVGSVGTRCFVLMLVDRLGNPLFLQVKEAEQSVLERHWPSAETLEPGRRVVEGQQIMQAASDVFLGWGSTRGGQHAYVRQLRDMKGSVEVELLSPSLFENYCVACGLVLARAHAQSGAAAEISAYLGASAKFDDAVADFAIAYARQVEQDHAQLVAAIDDGRIEAQRGV